METDFAKKMWLTTGDQKKYKAWFLWNVHVNMLCIRPLLGTISQPNVDRERHAKQGPFFSQDRSKRKHILTHHASLFCFLRCLLEMGFITSQKKMKRGLFQCHRPTQTVHQTGSTPVTNRIVGHPDLNLFDDRARPYHHWASPGQAVELFPEHIQAEPHLHPWQRMIWPHKLTTQLNYTQTA